MATPTDTRPVQAMPVWQWEQLFDPPGKRLELLDGEVIMNASPAMPHQFAVLRLMELLNAQCPADLVALTDVEWRIGPNDDLLFHAPRPDVFVATRDVALSDSPALFAPPVLAVEIASPHDKPSEVRRKEDSYREAGLGHFVRVGFDRDDVAVEWCRATDERWQIIATARGEEPLAIDEPFPVRFAPADLAR